MLNTGTKAKQYIIKSYTNDYADHVPACYKIGNIICLYANIALKKNMPEWTNQKIGYLQEPLNFAVTGGEFPIVPLANNPVPLFVQILDGDVFLCSRSAVGLLDWYCGNAIAVIL
ncbi:MAG: hypothetical protein NC432_11840 [Roseburia sp.]|nr:hypothetical protein [Roseburia sp.]MCM1099498.1 hypothetical protein [Ruminococcus flavefaciens]